MGGTSAGRRDKSEASREAGTENDRKNQRWSLDFVSDALRDSRRFRVLGVVDDFTRECLALIVDKAIADYSRAIEIDLSHVQSYLGRGVADVERRVPATAIADYSKAIALKSPPDLASGATHFVEYVIRPFATGKIGGLHDKAHFAFLIAAVAVFLPLAWRLAVRLTASATTSASPGRSG